VYLGAIAVGCRAADRRSAVLPLWIATIVLFQASLSGGAAAKAFMRFAVPAWPAAALVLWRWGGTRLPPTVVALACTAIGIFGLGFAQLNIGNAIGGLTKRPALERMLEDDRPRWRRYRDETGPRSSPAASSDAAAELRRD
jgi:hypothetical protein